MVQVFTIFAYRTTGTIQRHPFENAIIALWGQLSRCHDRQLLTLTVPNVLCSMAMIVGARIVRFSKGDHSHSVVCFLYGVRVRWLSVTVLKTSLTLSVYRGQLRDTIE